MYPFHLTFLPNSGFAEDLIQEFGVDGADDRLGGAVGLHDDEGGLEDDVEALEDITGVVLDLRKGEPMTFDEALVGVVPARPGDADEVDLTGESVGCGLDRGRFTIAGASSG